LGTARFAHRDYRQFESYSEKEGAPANVRPREPRAYYEFVTRNRSRALNCFLLLEGLAYGGSPWTQVWADEFNGPAHSAPDPSKWTFDLGASGWGNHELEDYTNSKDNVFVDGHGHLVIRAIQSASGKYTSGRIKTQGLYEVQFGKIEARIEIPRGQGFWPAFWMLGKDISNPGVGWPQSGEIDVMENIGKEPSIVHGTVHGPGYSAAKGITAARSLAGGAPFAAKFHVYGVEWSADSIEFFVDGKAYAKVTHASLPAGAAWVFDKPFFLLLNLAIGGDWPGNPDSTTVFPQSMLVDWIRVSKHE
jgi:beta-glucanase (GH16 family)